MKRTTTIAMAGALAFAVMATLVVSRPTAPRLTFDHATVYVRDLQRSTDFYEKAMGFERIAEPFHDGRHVWYGIGEHEQLHVVSGAKAASEQYIEVHFAFRVASMAEFTTHLDGMNVKYRSFDGKDKVTTRPDGVHQTYLQDPDGYWIEVNDGKS